MFRHDRPAGAEASTVERPPGPLDRLTVPSSLLDHTLRGLRGYAPAEGLCYWFGRELEPAVGLVMVAAFPRIYSTERSFQLAEGQMGRLTAWAGQRGLWLLAQAHSHPADEPHSPADEQWAPTWREGFLSVLLPFCAHLSTLRTPHWRVYECSAERTWTQVRPERLHILDDVWLPEA